MLKLITGHLGHLLKQRTYLATLLLFGHLALVTLPDRSPRREIGKRRNVTFPCATPLRPGLT